MVMDYVKVAGVLEKPAAFILVARRIDKGTDLEVSRSLRLTDFNRHMKMVRLSALRTNRL
jgi:hypothetical protein